MFIQMSNRMSDCTIRCALISLITVEIQKSERYHSIYSMSIKDEEKKPNETKHIVNTTLFFKNKD